MNRIRPSRLAGPALLGLALIGLAACGTTATAGGSSTTASASPSPRLRNGAAGELVQIAGTTLVLSATTGDVTVVYDTSTTFQKTSTGSFADISTGKCIVATGQKDAAGTIVVAAVRLTAKVNGTCTAAPGAGGGFGGGLRTPQPGSSPRPGATPGANRPRVDFAAGEISATQGTSVTVQPATGAAVVLTIPTTATVTRSAAVTAADLALHQCVQANGARDAAGKVAARAITIVPAGPSGCFTGGRGGSGGFGGFGGGRPGGGAPPAN